MVVCLYSPGNPEHLATPLAGRSTLERVRRFVAGLPAVERVAVAATAAVPDLPAGWQLRTAPSWPLASIVSLLAELSGGPDTTLLFGFLDEPFLDAGVARSMLERHAKYRADFTFADGYPFGFAPQVVAGRVLSHLLELCAPADGAPTREGLFPVVQKDINRIDVETELSRIDQRLLRLELNVSSAADRLLCERLAAREPADIDGWQTLLAGTRETQRTLPRYVNVQVVEQEVQTLSYSPYPLVRERPQAPGATMEEEAFDRLVAMLERFSPEAVVAISLWGEVSLHPGAIALVRRVLASPALSVYVETSGIGWSERAKGELLSIDDPRFTLIVGLDSNDPAIYHAVRGDGFEEAHAFARAAVSALPHRTCVQATRLDATEPALEPFYRGWKELTERIVIQKYDHFCGALPRRKIGDLSPLARFPCWHLQRDLTVLVDGTVPLCRDDLRCGRRLGNVFADGLPAVWEAGAPAHGEQVAGSYPGICADCDEYYTFNA